MQDGDMVVIIVVVSALVIGLLSMLVGRIVALYDRLRAWWDAKLIDAYAEMAKEKVHPQFRRTKAKFRQFRSFVYPSKPAQKPQLQTRSHDLS